ncbi:AAA family ATPase [Niallia sp. 03091]|uniref:AAA family ATPase n=1 Tax=unclassified Niallia TaxID=2837522 RepID=UPI00404484E1
MNRENKIDQTIEANIQIIEKNYFEKGIKVTEEKLLQLIQSLNEQQDSKELSILLTIAALARMETNEQDSIAIAWLNKAQQLDPTNKKAANYLSQHDWQKYQQLLQELIFPSIRETDNRTAKRKVAEQYINICKKFLHDVEEENEKLEAQLTAAKSFGNSQLITKYNEILALLNKVIIKTSQLLKSAEEYEESISGVFHTSIYYESVKKLIEELSELKQEWKHIFASEENKKKGKSSLDELQQMIGLETVKKRVKDYYRFLTYQKSRKALGYTVQDELSLNMIFTGNPGTGKTTLARLLASIYYELGVLPSEEVVEVDRSQLIGGFMGQTEENVRAVVKKALGGVLFIDEAYSLKREGQTSNDYGQAAIDTLVSLMTGTEFGGKFAVILAGYPEEMRQFLDSNHGLRSRFPSSNMIHLPNYNKHELLQIADKIASDNDYVITEGGKKELLKRLEKEEVDESFGNARAVKNIVLDAIFKKGSQRLNDQHFLAYTLLEEDDFAIDEEMFSENPAEKLESLIGLEAVKAELKKIIAFVKLQQVRREKGQTLLPIQLHAVFTGNPGTGKTTVAKLYAQFLKNCGMLKRGHLIVTSRADLVAGYVGQSAIKTKKKIKESLGGVLFIDEAYSLLNGSNQDFGKEVIDTLVMEMTKHNENLVVILAGYPNETEELLASNPGLKSRFKKFIHFEDYNAEQLINIMKAYASSYDYILTDEAITYIMQELNTTSIQGNGRFATNVIDEAVQLQALRLLEKDGDKEAEHSVLTAIDLRNALSLFKDKKE